MRVLHDGHLRPGVDEQDHLGLLRSFRRDVAVTHVALQDRVLARVHGLGDDVGRKTSEHIGMKMHTGI